MEGMANSFRVDMQTRSKITMTLTKTQPKNIFYIKNSKIDHKRWNDCIKNARNSRIYASYEYLDLSTKNWDALIWGDYEYVMPLPYTRKLGIKLYLQPSFGQQLGIFPKPDQKISDEFFAMLKTKSLFIKLCMNASFKEAEITRFNTTPRINYVLNMIPGYTELYAQYNSNTRRNIKKANNKYGISISDHISIESFIQGKKMSSETSDKDLAILHRIISHYSSIGMGMIVGGYTRENELCGAAFILKYNNRLIYLSAFSTDQGKDQSVMHAIVDSIIQRSAGTGLNFDFEGSMIPGVARFYKGFGAAVEHYTTIQSAFL